MVASFLIELVVCWMRLDPRHLHVMAAGCWFEVQMGKAGCPLAAGQVAELGKTPVLGVGTTHCTALPLN